MRIGIDLNTIREINDVSPGLGLKIEELQEIVDTTNNTHFKALVGLIHHNGKLYDNLLKQPNGFETARQARSYLLQNHTLIDASGKELEMSLLNGYGTIGLNLIPYWHRQRQNCFGIG